MNLPKISMPTRGLASPLVLLTAYLSTTIRAVENAPCYYPGGAPALGFYPCQAFDAPVSSCCPAGWTCFSNALCIATTNSNAFPNLTLGAVQRGACTNPKWNNNICGGACLGRLPVSLLTPELQLNIINSSLTVGKLKTRP